MRMKKDIVNILVGDSIAYGLGDNECFGWYNRLRKKDERFQKEFFFNLSIPGQSSCEIIKRFKSEFLTRYNNVDNFNILFAFGVKDALKLNDDEKYIKKFKQNVNELISFSKKYTNNIYFLGLLDVDINVRNNYSKKNIRIIDDTLESLCDANKVNYVKMSNVITFKDLVDGLHPNAKGHEKISLFLYEKLYK